MFSAPQPRSRLYTTAAAYARGATAALSGIGYESEGVAALERALEGLHPGCHAVAVPMARVGIYLTLKRLIRRGQKVILSPYTISDVVNMVLCAGGIPVFADIEEGGSCNIDARSVVQLLDSTDDVGAVLVTHFYGLICDIDPILEACRRRSIPVIEDAAQAFGARWKGARAGSLADAGILSFGLLKHVTGFVGGAVLTRHEELAQRIRQDLEAFTVFPRKALLKHMMTGAGFDLATSPPIFDTTVYWLFRHAYLHDVKFFNNKLDTDSAPVSYSSFPNRYAYRMSGVQADIITSQFASFEKNVEERIAKARLYAAGLEGVPGLTIPPMRTDGSHIYVYYSVLAHDRDELGRAMTRGLRDVQISHHRNCASLECFSAFHRDCPNAERASRQVLYLPVYPGYGEDQIRANIDAIRRFAGGSP
ncbi:MAG TPA: DegT/DnrJ/EryC1/StrS family aminotransferase [Vicinamibacterales bacterium]